MNNGIKKHTKKIYMFIKKKNTKNMYEKIQKII